MDTVPKIKIIIIKTSRIKSQYPGSLCETFTLLQIQPVNIWASTILYSVTKCGSNVKAKARPHPRFSDRYYMKDRMPIINSSLIQFSYHPFSHTVSIQFFQLIHISRFQLILINGYYYYYYYYQ